MYMVTETPIEAFNKISAHLIAQKTQSINAFGECMYRGLDGCKCAFGALIPDEVYDPSLEGKSIERLVAEDFLDFLYAKTRIVCATLQVFHDIGGYYESCRDTLRVEKALEEIELKLNFDV